MQYLKDHSRARETHQSEPIPGSTQVANSAGGHAWEVDDFTRLRRFLILGSEGGSYYASEYDLTKANVDAVRRCIETDGLRTVEVIREISVQGLAPKNDPALFALALASAAKDVATRQAALAALPDVARIGTHLYHFIAFAEGVRGWGPSLRKAVARWYDGKDVGKLAYQAVKYRQRDGWSHRDLLRLAHPKGATVEHKALYDWIVGREGVANSRDVPALTDNVGVAVRPRIVEGYLAAQASPSPERTAELVTEYVLPREALLTEHLNAPVVWDALLHAGNKGMPMTAMIRNLATMTRNGVIAPGSKGTQTVLAQLGDAEQIKAARIHPVAVLSALLTYKQGRGFRSDATWVPVTQIVDALDAAFYTSFGNVTPSGKRHLLALDVSGSMGSASVGVPGLTARDASAAMALITAATEPGFQAVGFTGTGRAYSYYGERTDSKIGGLGDGLTALTISPRRRLDDAISEVSNLPYGRTDCSLPMQAALKHGWEIDTFVVYTDSETWHGSIHPSQALVQYRERTGINAKLIVVGMVANPFSIADPNDAGMLDVVGFDTSAPQVMADFAAGRV